MFQQEEVGNILAIVLLIILVIISSTVAIETGIGNVGARGDGQIVACNDVHVLALYLYVARRSADGDALEGIDGDIAKGRLYAHLALVCRTSDGVESIIVCQFKTTTQLVVVSCSAQTVEETEFCKIGEWKQIGAKLAAWQVGKGEVMPIGRGDGLDQRTILCGGMVGGKAVLQVERPHHIGVLHIAVHKVYHNGITCRGKEHKSGFLRCHRGGNIYPGRGISRVFGVLPVEKHPDPAQSHRVVVGRHCGPLCRRLDGILSGQRYGIRRIGGAACRTICFRADIWNQNHLELLFVSLYIFRFDNAIHYLGTATYLVHDIGVTVHLYSISQLMMFVG